MRADRDTSVLFGDVGTDSSHAVRGSVMRYKVGTPTGMILGVDSLKAHRVLVSHSQRKMYFTYVGGPVFEGAVAPVGEQATLPESAIN